jgi:hypothetical protein
MEDLRMGLEMVAVVLLAVVECRFEDEVGCFEEEEEEED